MADGLAWMVLYAVAAGVVFSGWEGGDGERNAKVSECGGEGEDENT